MSSTSASPIHTLQDGTVLVINRAIRVADFPLALEVARHVRKAVVALKPDELQAPKDNEMDAQELTNRIGELLDFLDEVADQTGSDPNISENATGYLLELGQLRRNLHCSMSELQAQQSAGYATRLASQNRIRDLIQHKETQLVKAKFDVLMCLTRFTLTTGLQNTQAISQALQAVQALTDTCKALHQRQERLERRGDAVLPKRQIDGHGKASLAFAVLGSRYFFFFTNR